MSALHEELQALSDDARRALAHALVLTLDGRRSGNRTVSAEDAGERAMPAPDVGPAEAAFAAARAREGQAKAADGRAGRISGGEAAGSAETAGPAEDSGQTAVQKLYGDGGRVVTLRREVPTAVGGTEEGADTSSGAAPAEDRVQRLRELSEYFRQDSRRYDPGFTRY